MKQSTFKAILIKTGFAASILLLGSGVAFAQSVNLTGRPLKPRCRTDRRFRCRGYTCTALPLIPVPSGISAPLAQPPTERGDELVAGGDYGSVQPVWYQPDDHLTNNLQFSTTDIPPFNNVPTSLVIVGQVGGGLVERRPGLPVRRTRRRGSPGSSQARRSVHRLHSFPALLPRRRRRHNCPPGQPSRVQSFATEVGAGETTALCWGPGCTVRRLLSTRTYLIHSGTHPSIQSDGCTECWLVTTAPVTEQCRHEASLIRPARQFTTAEVSAAAGESMPVQNAAVATASRPPASARESVERANRRVCDPNAGRRNREYLLSARG